MRADKSHTQARIKAIVKEYMNFYNSEYQLFKTSIKIKRDLQSNKFSEVKNGDYMECFAYEIPETLFNIFGQMLTEEDRIYYQSKEGAKWFAKAFPQFAIAEKL